MNNFLTIDEVAQTLKVTRQTVAKYIQKKALNAVKINKSYRVSYVELENFLLMHSIVSQQQIIYFRKSKNCVLDYRGKSDESDILTSKHLGSIRPLEINHKGDFNSFIFGDNFFILKAITKELRGKIDLIYIDPPYGTGQNFTNIDNDHAYSDRLVNGDFLEFLRRRLFLLRELLSQNGSIYLHIDKKIGHYVKIIMDEVFGSNNFINDITRIKCNPKNFSRNAYGNCSDMILFYAKERDKNIWNEVKEELTKEEEAILFPKHHPEFSRYTTNPLHAPGETLDGDTGKEWKGLNPPKGRHWRYSREELTRLDKEGLIEWSETGNPRKIVFAKDHKGKKVQDVWEYKDKGLSYVDYPTQKNHDLLRRIILNSSNENSLVLDCFAGSGSTLLVANELNRKWIGIDNSTHALDVIKNIFKREKVDCNFLNMFLSLNKEFNSWYQSSKFRHLKQFFSSKRIMNDWSRRTLHLVINQNYLDQLQLIYSHEEGEREVDDVVLTSIRDSFVRKDETSLLNQLLGLEKFPYKDSYVGFLRKDRTAIERNPETVRRICDRLYNMGIENIINGVKQSKEANTRRGPQFGNWIRNNFRVVSLKEFTQSTEGIVILGANELEARDFCNRSLGIGISKRPDIVAKSGRKYVVGEAKFLSSTGGNQGRAFDDGIHLATNASGSAYKIFVLDGIHWIERGSDQYRRIEHSTAAIFSVLLLNDFLQDLA